MKRFLLIGLFVLSFVLTAKFSSSFANAQPLAFDGDQPMNARINSVTAAPKSDDEHFVADTGGELDQYLFRTDGDGYIKFNIPITRYYFNTQDTEVTFDSDGFLTGSAASSLISRNILPATATLRLRVWDVDEDASWCPEVDHIYVNGKPLYQNSSRAKLSGANATWSTPSFKVPIQLLKFPQAKGVNGNAPQAVNNEISVQIDVSGCTTSDGEAMWAVAVDWGVIELPGIIRPIIFVHGYTGSTTSFDTFEDWLKRDGIPSAGQVYLQRGIYSISDTAGWLKDGFVGSGLDGQNHYGYDGIEDEIIEFGVDKLNIFAHSKGGLVTRWALRDDTVAEHTEHAITFASPHHGTKQAELDAKLWILCKQFSGGDYDLCMENGREFRRDSMRNGFNYTGCVKEHFWSSWTNCTDQYVKQPDVIYYSFAANGDEAVKPLESTTYPWNADAKPFPNEINVDERFDVPNVWEWGGGDHSGILAQESVYQCAISYISDIYGSSNCPSSSQVALTLLDEDYQIALVEEGTLAPGGNRTYIASLDSGTKAVFEIYSDDVLVYTLTDPNGRFINASVANTDPNITYLAKDNGGIWVYQYQILSPMAGDWQNQLQTSNEANYIVTNQTNSTIQLNAVTGKLTYQPGDLVTLETALSNGSTPYTGVTWIGLVTHPDNTTTSLSFYDDGSHGDTTPNDGIYASQFTASSTNGHAIISVNAAKNDIVRVAENSIAIASQTAQFQQVLGEYPLDTNGNGLYDSLELSISVNVVNSGHFAFQGTLVDGTGQPIATGYYSTLMAGNGTLPTGLQTVVLRFDGSQIYQHGVNGPYKLTNLTIFDVTEFVLEVDSSINVYTTLAYQASQFEHPLIMLGSTGETPTDYDGNGRYDILWLHLNVDLAQSGVYDVNGRLIDANGDEIGWSTSIFTATVAGTYQINLAFDGYEIGDQQANGPYTLSDLSIFNQSGLGSAIFGQAYTTQAYSFTEFEGGYYKTYLPTILNGDKEPQPDFFDGTVTYAGSPVSNTALELRFYDGSSRSTYATTTTNSNGYYQFSDLPILGADQWFYVRWANPTSNSNWLSYWSCWSVDANDDAEMFSCDFDLKDVSLVSPNDGANITLPYTFQWNTRGISSDDYELDLADRTDYDPYWYSAFGYVDSYTMVSLPTDFYPNEQYAWWMWVYGPDGYGISYYYRTVTFLNSGTLIQGSELPMNVQLLKENMEILSPPKQQR